MKQHAQQQHKPAAGSGEQKKKPKGEKKGEQKGARKQERTVGGAANERAESDRAAAHEGQLPQNQQRLGQHQNSRKQP